MKTSTALIIAGGIVVGALVWKRVGDAKNKALAQAASATATANKLADSINATNQAIAPVTSSLGEALGWLNNTFSAIGGSNVGKTWSGPGQGQYI